MSTCSRLIRPLIVSASKGRKLSMNEQFVHTSRFVSTSSFTLQKWSTPLAKNLAEAIATTGPISVAAYMRQCLTSPDGGYYMKKDDNSDQFGAKGDFVTSPEISQVFGELVGIWIVSEWMSQGSQAKPIYLMELGPGRGTLMDDMLRAISKFKHLASLIDTIYLVEASASLREAQKKLICSDDDLEKVPSGFKGRCKHLGGIPVIWCEDIKFVPDEVTKTPFIIAHEFFDALPIHIFQNISTPAVDSLARSTEISSNSKHVSMQWREMLVAPASGPLSLDTSSANYTPEFELVLAKAPTPHSLYLPQTSGRYRKMRKIENSIIEVSPDSISYASNIASRIGGSTDKAARFKPTFRSEGIDQTSIASSKNPSGAALILDYGNENTVPANTLRGIRQHRICSPFSSPGKTDLSANVDFLAIAEAAIEASDHVEVHGPINQGVWLNAMGANARAEVLLNRATDSGKERIKSGLRRLTDQGPVGMGRIYKAMAIVPHFHDSGVRRPVGFGGSLAY